MGWIGWVLVGVCVIVSVAVVLMICALCIQSGRISRWEEERDRRLRGG